MTENEAIQFLDNIKHAEVGRAIGKDGFYAELMGYHVEALNMAIKALEQKPCNTDTCKVVKAYMNEWDKPITAEPKTGHWIEKDGFDGDVYYDCSECGESWTTIEGTPWDNEWNYCPNCGAKMVEPQEGGE